jgi:hypothetical protein
MLSFELLSAEPVPYCVGISFCGRTGFLSAIASLVRTAGKTTSDLADSGRGVQNSAVAAPVYEAKYITLSMRCVLTLQGLW